MTDSKNVNENVVEETKNTPITTTPSSSSQTEDKPKEEEKPLTVADFSGEQKEEIKKEEKPNPTTPTNGDNGPTLKHMTDEFISDVMSVPACSESEYRMVTYIMLWCRKRGIRYDFDRKGNIYLTKGEIAEGEYYPCLTSHLDTVQDKQKSYAEAGMRLPLKYSIDTTTKKHKVSVDGMGIGADCRAGIAISLAIIEKFDVIKAAFFLEEEIGMRGSKELDVEWFDNVGYVIGYDSPDLNRAAWKCSGYRLFDKDFFENHLEEICKKHGLTNFKDEPFTDVCQIREKTNLTCMNFGNGGYNAHMQNEYILLEDMDTACGMGIELIEHLGNNLYECHTKGKSNDWVRKDDGTYERPKDDDDNEFFRKKFSTYTYYQGGYYQGGGTRHSGYNSNNYHYSGSTSGGTTTQSSTTTPSTPKVDTVPTETVKYISEKYDEEINRIKENIKKKCEEMNLNFEECFAEVFAEEIKF